MKELQLEKGIKREEDRERGREEKEERRDLEPVLEPAKARSQQLPLSLPCGWQEPRCVGHLPLFFKTINRELEQAWSS